MNKFKTHTTVRAVLVEAQTPVRAEPVEASLSKGACQNIKVKYE